MIAMHFHWYKQKNNYNLFIFQASRKDVYSVEQFLVPVGSYLKIMNVTTDSGLVAQWIMALTRRTWVRMYRGAVGFRHLRIKIIWETWVLMSWDTSEEYWTWRFCSVGAVISCFEDPSCYLCRGLRKDISSELNCSKWQLPWPAGIVREHLSIHSLFGQLIVTAGFSLYLGFPESTFLLTCRYLQLFGS